MDKHPSTTKKRGLCVSTSWSTLLKPSSCGGGCGGSVSPHHSLNKFQSGASFTIILYRYIRRMQCDDIYVLQKFPLSCYDHYYVTKTSIKTSIKNENLCPFTHRLTCLFPAREAHSLDCDHSVQERKELKRWEARKAKISKDATREKMRHSGRSTCNNWTKINDQAIRSTMI